MKFEKDIKIILKQELIKELEICVDNARQNEACGLIFGRIETTEIAPEDFQNLYEAQKFSCIKSNEKSPVAFLINDVETLYKVIKESTQEDNIRVISIFHSHPSGSYPSGVDYSNMKQLDAFTKTFQKFTLLDPYQIWTIMDAKTFELNGFIFLDGEISQIDVIIK